LRDVQSRTTAEKYSFFIKHMVKILSSSHFLINILIIIISAFISFHLKVVPYNETITQGFTEINKIIFRWIKGDYFSLLYQAISFAFLILNIFLFSNLMISLRLSKVGDKLQGFVFLLLCGIVLPYVTNVPNIMISFSLFLIMIKSLFGILRKQDILFQLFNIGLLLACASFFWYYSCYFFPYIFFGIIILRTIELREWIAAILGLIIPYFLFLSIYFFMHSNFDMIFDLIQIINYKEILPELNSNDLCILIFILFLLFIATGKIALRYRSMQADVQDFLRLFFILFLFSMAVFFVYPGFRFSSLLFSILPISVPIVYLIKESKRYIFKEIIIDVLIVSVLFNQLGVSLFPK
jgi:hypothetical protein